VWCVSHIARGGVVGVRVGGTIRESGTAGMRQRGWRRTGLPTVHLCQATDVFIRDEALWQKGFGVCMALQDRRHLTALLLFRSC